ncbi:CubicO group peptidase, beta-lactamase class C family [Parasphingorhabdus marina DSM 22363]|uniref:CubicO group peptidase, beta-lactamase class C family n=1 Tax=Parasphingorhabdus marina DSM 22363 TaxID=1123272 RepID=A0A1N6CLZ1_9SPHN|nr:serine hydrolase domain-containing protein [Parasphingorhabdus marina]SIN59505.1 CubicO group peptidase, beta-lactamase class C family [Parasphingorhabdus marina DSM 22363]
MTETIIHGEAQDRFASVRNLMAASVNSGEDVGLSFTATIEGETVVDLWGGWADAEKSRPWERDTIVNVYSTTKTMTALTALLVADRGELDFDKPVAHYWPEFAQGGKENVTVAHLMSHASGLSGWEESLTTEDLYDWEKATSLLAAQEPWWEPGTTPGYHAITQGYLVGEVVRRITGKSLGTVFREEIAEPLDADFHIGLPPEHDHRVADLIPPEAGVGDGDFSNDIQRKTFINPPIDPLSTRTREWRGAEIPAAGGTGNARSVAEIHALLANGGVAKGKRILSEAGCRKALEPQIEGNDMVLMNLPIKYGLGFGLPGEMIPLPNPNTIFWGGYGGSVIVIDMDKRTTFSYVMNKMNNGLTGDPRSFNLMVAMWTGMAAG